MNTAACGAVADGVGDGVVAEDEKSTGDANESDETGDTAKDELDETDEEEDAVVDDD